MRQVSGAEVSLLGGTAGRQRAQDSGFGLSDAAMDVEECLPEGLPEGLPDEPNWPALAALPGSREV